MGNTYDKYASQMKEARGITQGQLNKANAQVDLGNSIATGFQSQLNPYLTNALSSDALANYLSYAQSPVEQGKGFDPDVMAAMRSTAMNSLPGQYENAMKQLRIQALRQGGGMGGMSPGMLPGMASLYGGMAFDRSKMLNDIILANEQQKQTQFANNLNAKQIALQGLAGGWGAGNQMFGNYLGGINAGLNTANSALNTGANLAQTWGSQVQQPKQSDMQGGSWLSKIGGSLLGAGTSFLTGGLSNILGGGGFFNPKQG